MGEPLKTFTRMFAKAVRLYGGVRETARLTGMDKSTVSRIARGHAPDIHTAQFAGAMLGICPCCGIAWPKEPSHD